MTKQELMSELRKKLSGLPKRDIEERLSFYSEMIDDRMEEGYTEREAVRAIGSADEIAAQIIRDIPLTKIAKERIKPQRGLRAWEILLLILGSPVWLSLAIAAFAIILSLYAVLWSLVVSVWAVFVSLVACSLGGVFAGIVFATHGNGFIGVATLAASIVCAGIGILLFFACKAATKGTVSITAMIGLGIKRLFVGKERG